MTPQRRRRNAQINPSQSVKASNGHPTSVTVVAKRHGMQRRRTPTIAARILPMAGSSRPCRYARKKTSSPRLPANDMNEAEFPSSCRGHRITNQGKTDDEDHDAHHGISVRAPTESTQSRESNLAPATNHTRGVRLRQPQQRRSCSVPKFQSPRLVEWDDAGQLGYQSKMITLPNGPDVGVYDAPLVADKYMVDRCPNT